MLKDSLSKEKNPLTQKASDPFTPKEDADSHRTLFSLT